MSSRFYQQRISMCLCSRNCWRKLRWYYEILFWIVLISYCTLMKRHSLLLQKLWETSDRNTISKRKVHRRGYWKDMYFFNLLTMIPVFLTEIELNGDSQNSLFYSTCSRLQLRKNFNFLRMYTINNMVTFLEKIFVKDSVFTSDTAALIFITNCGIIDSSK